MGGLNWIKIKLHNAWYEVAECYNLQTMEKYLLCNRANDEKKKFKITYSPVFDTYYFEAFEKNENKYISRLCMTKQMMLCAKDSITFLDILIEKLFENLEKIKLKEDGKY